MSKAMKFNVIQVITWSIIAVGMGLIFASGDTIGEWEDNKTKSVLLAALFLLGYGTDFIIRIIEKSKRWGMKRDERDKTVQYQALSIGFILLMIYLFVLCIGLYEYYEGTGYIPIAWVWFIAYSTIVVANLVSGYASLYYYKKQGL
jgi:hypothetical protein